MKRFAAKGLIILAVTVFVCIFFSNTIQTITTPKVKLTSPTRGRLEVAIPVSAEIYFPDKESVILKDAKNLSVTIDKVSVRAGSYVTKGTALFTTTVGAYQDEKTKLRDELTAKEEERAELDIANRKLSQASHQNELYEAMMRAESVLDDAKYTVRRKAKDAGISLTGDLSEWKHQLNLAGESAGELTELISTAEAAQAAYDEATKTFYAVYEDRKLRVSNDTFTYINKRNKLLKEIEAINVKMLDLDDLAASLQTICAEHDGWIAEISVKAGDTYDGSGSLYAITPASVQPVLRAAWTEKERTAAEGTRVDLTDENGDTQKTEVSSIQIMPDGSKYLQIAFPKMTADEQTKWIASLFTNGSTDAKVIFRGKSSATLLPASAVRDEGDSSYVYVAQQALGNLLSSSGLKAVKTTVTVLDRNDKQVAISEEMSYQQIAYQEDRALSDGCRIMEYLN